MKTVKEIKQECNQEKIKRFSEYNSVLERTVRNHLLKNNNTEFRTEFIINESICLYDVPEYVELLKFNGYFTEIKEITHTTLSGKSKKEALLITFKGE